MRKLIVDNHVITTPLFEIVKDIKYNIFNGKLKDIREDGDNIRVTCPIHKGGKENKASSFIYRGDDGKTEYGVFHCFTCGAKLPFFKFVAYCFDKNDDWAKKWLLHNYSSGIITEESLELPEIDLNEKVEKKILDSDILNTFESFHPYMTKRKLSKEVCKRFDIKYDSKSHSLVFPVMDEKGDLVMLTRRSVIDKRFYIDKNAEKPVYLLYHLEKVNEDTCIVTESQINCLTCYSYDLPSICLFGTGTKHQYDVLNRSSIRHYILCFDGDEAGDKGAERFLKNIRKDVFVDVIKIPRGKDINDLSKEEFVDLLEDNMLSYKQISDKYKNCINN